MKMISDWPNDDCQKPSEGMKHSIGNNLTFFWNIILLIKIGLGWTACLSWYNLLLLILLKSELASFWLIFGCAFVFLFLPSYFLMLYISSPLKDCTRKNDKNKKHTIVGRIIRWGRSNTWVLSIFEMFSEASVWIAATTFMEALLGTISSSYNISPLNIDICPESLHVHISKIVFVTIFVGVLLKIFFATFLFGLSILSNKGPIRNNIITVQTCSEGFMTWFVEAFGFLIAEEWAPIWDVCMQCVFQNWLNPLVLAWLNFFFPLLIFIPIVMANHRCMNHFHSEYVPLVIVEVFNCIELMFIKAAVVSSALAFDSALLKTLLQKAPKFFFASVLFCTFFVALLATNIETLLNTWLNFNQNLKALEAQKYNVSFYIHLRENISYGVGFVVGGVWCDSMMEYAGAQSNSIVFCVLLMISTTTIAIGAEQLFEAIFPHHKEHIITFACFENIDGFEDPLLSS